MIKDPVLSPVSGVHLPGRDITVLQFYKELKSVPIFKLVYF